MKDKRLFLLLRPYKSKMILAIIMGILASLLSVIFPRIIGQLSNVIQEGLKDGINYRMVVILVAVCVALALLSFLFNLLQSRTMVNVSSSLTKSLRSKINRKIDKLPISYFDGHRTGDILSRIINDVDQLNDTLINGITTTITSVATILGCLVLMFVTNWILAFCVIISTFLGTIFTHLCVKKGGPYFKKQMAGLGMINSDIDESFNGHTVIKAFNSEEEVKEQFKKKNEMLYETAWKSQFLTALMTPIMSFIGNFGYVVVCIVGSLLLLTDMPGSSVGTIVAFILYMRLFQTPVTRIAQVSGAMQPAVASTNRVFEILGEEEITDEKKDKRLESVKGDISFSHVKFGYVKERTIIHDFSAEIKHGQKIAIVGPTGAGKTTMVNLLMRFYELDDGHIAIDGVPIQDLTRENLHELVGMVLQDTWTFEGTIRENIVYSTEGVSDERVKEVIHEVGLDYFVSTMPEGIDTVLSEQTEVSAGQKQLITIARAMVENPSVLILDEATSSVDTRIEKIIQNAIDKLTEGRTSFVIAHRLSTIRNADAIFVMKDGDVVEVGTHDELLKKNGLYAELYNSQFDEKTA